MTRDVEAQALMLGSPARRRGWVCHCARPLRAQGGRLVCPECGRAYALERAETGTPSRLALVP